MSTGKTILVAVDFECDGDNVVDRAILVAKLLGCDIEVLFCDSSNSLLGARIAISSQAEVLRAKILAMQENLVTTLADRAIESGVPAIASVLYERPFEDGIMARAEKLSPCMIMKGTEFHSYANRGMLVDTDWQLMRTCRFPLWFVKRESFDEQPTIVAAVDPMHSHKKSDRLDQVIVDSAKTIARPTDGRVHLLHTYQRLTELGSAVNKAVKASKIPIDKIDQKTKAAHRTALDALANANSIDPDCTHQYPGRPKEIIPSFVRGQDADLIVMGALARWGLDRIIIGSTAERVLDHVSCDVLIVRDNDCQLPS